jgi:hypothetical protein
MTVQPARSANPLDRVDEVGTGFLNLGELSTHLAGLVFTSTATISKAASAERQDVG